MSKTLTRPALQEHMQNNILAALPADAYQRLSANLELVLLKAGSILYEAETQLRYIYFPDDCVISLLCGTEDGTATEIAVTGNEGVAGTSLFLGGKTDSHRALVQSSGYAYRLGAGALRREFAMNGPLQQTLLRYTQALMTMTAQIAVCNRHHSLEQQLCRWLLLHLDRLHSNELHMTQELIAHMLGVRREGVTEAAGKLQAAGIINYSRGRINVINRPELEKQACECYAAINKGFMHLLPPSQTESSSFADRIRADSSPPFPSLWREKIINPLINPGAVSNSGNWRKS